jgi:predicted flap endonuclease-1-like 5' DNA nuclease
LSFGEALKRKIPIDPRRSTKHEENVQILKTVLEPMATKEVRIVELTEVKRIGMKTAKKLKEAGIENANELATSSPQSVAEVLGSSETRAIDFIENARSLLKK